jgi:hypothetical protein
MNQYGKAALKAVEIYKKGDLRNIVQAWKYAITKFTNSKTSQEKGCPKYTFLGLCEEGLLAPIVPRKKYTDSDKNKTYGLRALEALRKKPELAESPAALWNSIETSAEKEEGQMGVVIALWSEGLIK